MQTFLPYADFKQSAEVLDKQRLGKQRVEAYQILRALLGITNGWIHHPATKMWRGYERALAEYAMAMCANGSLEEVKIPALIASGRLCHRHLWLCLPGLVWLSSMPRTGVI